MKCKYTLTFEFESAQSIVVKGKTVAGTVRTVAARALDDATASHPGVNWNSIVLLIERDNDKATEDLTKT